MPSASFRFYEELNDFLPPDRRKASFERAFNGRPAVKDMIEGLGIPHTEVDLILIDGESADFSAPLFDGARVSVYPMFEALDITPVTRVRLARFALADSCWTRILVAWRVIFDCSVLIPCIAMTTTTQSWPVSPGACAAFC